MQSVVITGVSTGIGYGAAEVLIKKGFRVFGSVRKQADADRLRAELGQNYTPLLFDVTDQAAIEVAAQQVRDELKGQRLCGLVNNAGVAATGPLLEIDPGAIRDVMEINLLGPVMVTQAFASLLGVDRALQGAPGRIVNISSQAGIRALPFLGPYAASKFALEGYSEALRRELMMFGIDVIVIGPGPVKTAIWDKAEDIDIEQYATSPYRGIMENFQKLFISQGRKGYTQEHLGLLIHKALTTERPAVRYAAVNAPLSEKLLTSFAPKRLLDRVIAKKLGLVPGDGQQNPTV
jgi:NAD(P)-dependent dehydrogenase (short-subunit alcohol dehydrogenase family)